jgi:hypothetical protein
MRCYGSHSLVPAACGGNSSCGGLLLATDGSFVIMTGGAPLFSVLN